MLYTPLTKKALTLCFEAHKDQVDKTGLPYVFHPFYLVCGIWLPLSVITWTELQAWEE